MNINPILFHHMIKSGAAAQKTTGAAEAAAGGHAASQFQDTITISREGSSQSFVSGLSRKIAGELTQLEHPARIEELREVVSSGNYHVPSSEVAGAILGFHDGL